MRAVRLQVLKSCSSSVLQKENDSLKHLASLVFNQNKRNPQLNTKEGWQQHSDVQLRAGVYIHSTHNPPAAFGVQGALFPLPRCLRHQEPVSIRQVYHLFKMPGSLF